MIAVLGECVADSFATRHPAAPGGPAPTLTADPSRPAGDPPAPAGGASRPGGRSGGRSGWAGRPAGGGPSRESGRPAGGEVLPGEEAEGLALRVLPGGGPANTAVALARLGTPTRFLGRLSRDVFGEMFRDRFTASGVDLSACVEAEEPSTLSVAALDPHGRAAFTFYTDGAADWQWRPHELDARRAGPFRCLHTGSMALVGKPGRDAVEEFASSAAEHATISIDPNARPSFATRDDYQVTRWCGWTDILKLSDDDLDFLLPGTSMERACDTWHAAGARLIVVTRGAAGALVSVDGERAGVRAPEVDVVDTVGAGDAFTAGLLHALDAQGHLGGRLDDLDLATAVAAAGFATRVAALTCSVAGANPPWSHHLTTPAPR
ncbi:carbohydrate kinase [Nonomuraea sp. B10E15]|uniref:carbohydrate kinase family protein n=1 Tax=Nonomuraea sp. B10E15 TaxID=3153560 RepID=UPI00325C8A64